MSTLVVVLLITLATGSFFLAMIIAVSRIQPRVRDEDAGAPEGNLHLRAIEDEFRREDF